MPSFQYDREVRHRWGRASFLALGFLLIRSNSVSAEVIQLLHTGDLHSHFEHGETRDRGHYAALKTVLDSLRAEGAAQGFHTLTLDSGDFTEGTAFYFAEEGAASWRAMDLLGYDAVALGNHDYLTGQADIDRLIRTERPRFALLAANFAPENRLRNLNNHLRASRVFQLGKVRLGVIGLTTDEVIYRWRVGRGTITAPRGALIRESRRLKKETDALIALTHVGIETDKAIMKSVPGIDFVLGGHSHTELKNPWMMKNPAGHYVPILHSGKHGHNVGRALIEVLPGKKARLLSYHLIPVYVSHPHDPVVAAFVRSARARFEAQLGGLWLKEPIGTSRAPMLAPNSGDTVWGNIFGAAMRAETGADLSIDAGPLFGDWQEAGPITREKLLNFYPRTFEYGPGIGWSIWLAECDGWIIDLVANQFRNMGYYATLGGEDAHKLVPFKRYRVAIPESIGRALLEIAPGLDLIFQNPRNTGIKVLDAVERQILRLGGKI